MTSLLDEVRGPLLFEAHSSPALLSDVAGLEKYIAESYSARAFVELLQNADDAGAARFLVEGQDELLIVANDGHAFTTTEFMALCRSAASLKRRGTSIGYRGIGFKSVIGIADVVHLVSGDVEASFSRERTHAEIPEAAAVPLIRIPHPVLRSDWLGFGERIAPLQMEGFTTFFVFDALLADAVKAEIESFDPSILLFLNHVTSISLFERDARVKELRTKAFAWSRASRRLSYGGDRSEWIIAELGRGSLAFRCDEGKLSRVPANDAVVHAFLPTHEPTGFSFKLNGDISTDPSRTRAVLDNRTASVVADAALLILKLLEEALHDDGNIQLMTTLMPTGDPRLASLQRQCFATELYGALRVAAQGRLSDVILRPAWLNAADFAALASIAGIRHVPSRVEGIEALSGLLKYLGAREATIADVAPSLKKSALSITGAAELAAYLATSNATGRLERLESLEKWLIWPSGNQIMSLNAVVKKRLPLARGFIDSVMERTGSPADLRRLLCALTDSAVTERLLDGGDSDPVNEIRQGIRSGNDRPDTVGSNGAEPSEGAIGPALTRWRAAEQQVLELLRGKGWAAEDVSRQNIGYDIDAYIPSGARRFVEVKALDRMGRPFILTSNEEAVARQRGESYLLTLVVQTEKYLEVAFIQDPMSQLELTRQCRQWVWECSNYDVKAERFQFAS